MFTPIDLAPFSLVSRASSVCVDFHSSPQTLFCTSCALITAPACSLHICSAGWSDGRTNGLIALQLLRERGGVRRGWRWGICISIAGICEGWGMEGGGEEEGEGEGGAGASLMAF